MKKLKMNLMFIPLESFIIRKETSYQQEWHLDSLSKSWETMTRESLDLMLTSRIQLSQLSLRKLTPINSLIAMLPNKTWSDARLESQRDIEFHSAQPSLLSSQGLLTIFEWEQFLRQMLSLWEPMQESLLGLMVLLKWP